MYIESRIVAARHDVLSHIRTEIHQYHKNITWRRKSPSSKQTTTPRSEVILISHTNKCERGTSAQKVNNT